MSLQDEINADVAAIQAAISTAQGAALGDSATVDLGQVRAAFESQQEYINGLEARIAALEGGASSPGSSPNVEDASISLSSFRAASEATTDAAARMTDLLITQSNFDGAGETE